MHHTDPVVYIAGLGIISAIGNDLPANLAAFDAEQPGMGDITRIETIHRNVLPVAEVRLSNAALAARAGVSAHWPRTALLSAVAAKESLQDAGIGDVSKLRAGFISANTTGGMDLTEHFFTSFRDDISAGHLRDVVNHECGAVTDLVADAIGISHYISTINTACSSSANAIFFGARMIKHNMLDVVVAGGTDALTKFTINGFNTLMILDKEFCKPFDENRRGLNLGEGAAYVVLVSERLMKGLSKKPYAYLSGYANANDAYHQTASSPEGTGSWLAMSAALKRSGLAAKDIDYINLHGTGTQNNDVAEGTAVQRLFAPHYPKMSSTKSFTGHTLGASGSIEAVYACMAIEKGIIYPNLRFATPMKEFDFVPDIDSTSVLHFDYVFGSEEYPGYTCSSFNDVFGFLLTGPGYRT
ncbi:MAG: beta-ketoacyl-[acyl-carrier-protein] synthase family protein [Chitinophagaceae bacterium]|nr:MAG: beta-ketoacyl-[acyl-carrier-protein] synthase family protein [Chitinophagaceae bacterium]